MRVGRLSPQDKRRSLECEVIGDCTSIKGACGIHLLVSTLGIQIADWISAHRHTAEVARK
jgi:hypothetical protein